MIDWIIAFLLAVVAGLLVGWLWESRRITGWNEPKDRPLS